MTEQIKASEAISMEEAILVLQDKYQTRFKDLEFEIKAFRRSLQGLLAVQQSQVDLFKSELANDLRLFKLQIESASKEK